MSGFGADAPHVFDPVDPFTVEEKARVRPEPMVVVDPPPFDPTTGEVLEAPQEPSPVSADADEPVRPLEDRAGVDSLVLDISPQQDVAAFTRDLRARVEGRIDSAYSALYAARRDDQPVEVAVRPEVRWLAASHDTLMAMAGVFRDAAGMVKSIAADVVQDARPDRDLVKRGGSASLRVPVTPGATSEVKVTATRPTEAFADVDAILDVLVAHLLTDYDGNDITEYALGARAALAAAQDVTSPWKVKTSALDVLVRRLPEDLAGRLRAAYGRRPVDREPTVKFEAVEV